jgi:hypothetical protein
LPIWWTANTILLIMMLFFWTLRQVIQAENKASALVPQLRLHKILTLSEHNSDILTKQLPVLRECNKLSCTPNCFPMKDLASLLRLKWLLNQIAHSTKMKRQKHL